MSKGRFVPALFGSRLNAGMWCRETRSLSSDMGTRREGIAVVEFLPDRELKETRELERRASRAMTSAMIAVKRLSLQFEKAAKS